MQLQAYKIIKNAVFMKYNEIKDDMVKTLQNKQKFRARGEQKQKNYWEKAKKICWF